MKKLLSILLALVLATGLFAACSGSGSGSQAAGSTASGSGDRRSSTQRLRIVFINLSMQRKFGKFKRQVFVISNKDLLNSL